MAITLKNEHLQLNVLPERGGGIDDLIDLQSGRNWLWHPAGYRAPEDAVELGSPFETHFGGSWEEMFPNDAPGVFEGRDLPDHGEVWSQRWRVLEEETYGVQMSAQCRRAHASLEKTIVLDRVLPRFEITYTVQNQSEPQRGPLRFKKQNVA